MSYFRQEVCQLRQKLYEIIQCSRVYCLEIRDAYTKSCQMQNELNRLFQLILPGYP